MNGTVDGNSTSADEQSSSEGEDAQDSGRSASDQAASTNALALGAAFGSEKLQSIFLAHAFIWLHSLPRLDGILRKHCTGPR